jgi:hypothetical protein
MRRPYGSKKRIPGLLMFPNKDPIYLSLNPAQIKTFLTYDHFLGKRYMLVCTHITARWASFSPLDSGQQHDV